MQQQIPIRAKPNRRGTQRKRPRMTVRVECRRGSLGFGPNIADGFLDLSESGLRLILKTPLPLQQEVEILLTGYGVARPVRRLATVCWSLPLEDGRFCTGLCFDKRLLFREVQQLTVG
jgi:hypothetical protein